MSERERFVEWHASLSTEERYDFDSEGRGYKKDAGHMMWLAWKASAALARSGQAASGSSQGARSDDLKKPADAQDDDRAAFAWWCRKNGHGELDDMLTPLDRSLRALMWPVWQGAIAYMAAAKIGQPEAPTAAPPTALERFFSLGADEETDPVERLRAFCSLAMRGQDWIDVEQFFDALAAPPARSGAGSEEGQG